MSAAAIPAESERNTPHHLGPQRISPFTDAAKDLADYQRLPAESKLGEARQNLEELRRALDKLNTRQR